MDRILGDRANHVAGLARRGQLFDRHHVEGRAKRLSHFDRVAGETIDAAPQCFEPGLVGVSRDQRAVRSVVELQPIQRVAQSTSDTNNAFNLVRSNTGAYAPAIGVSSRPSPAS